MEKDKSKSRLRKGEFRILKGKRAMTRRSVFAAAALVCAVASAGVEWNGLSEDNWYSGRKLDAEIISVALLDAGDRFHAA